MAQKKYARFQIPAVGAGATTGELPVLTPDDTAARRVTGIRSTDSTKLIRTVLMKTGQPMADIDDGIFAAYLDFVPVDIVYPGGVNITLDIRNSSAGTLLVNTNAVVIQYEPQ